MKYKIAVVFLAILSINFVSIIAYEYDEYYCRNHPYYQICHRCKDVDEICDRQEQGCHCDNIAIFHDAKQDFIGGSNCESTDDANGAPFCYVRGDSNCKDIQFSNRASGYEDLWYPKEDGKSEIYYSYEACLPENVIKSSNGQSVTGNGEIMEGIKFSFDYLLSEAGDKIQFTFDDPDYIEGNDFEEDFTSGIIQCQQQCLARNKNKGVCGAWSFDALTETCQLFNVDACCGQLDKQENAASFISGYACPHCWSTHNECPCGLARRQACPTCSLHSAGAGKPTLTSPTGLLQVDEIKLNPDLCEQKPRYNARSRKWIRRKPCCNQNGCLDPSRCRKCKKSV